MSKARKSYQLCSRWTMYPAEFVYFKAGAVDANKVELMSTQEDGVLKKKSIPYDPIKMRSSSRVNLWIDTVFQDPLLAVGENKIQYVLSKDGQVAEAGDFIAEVTVDQQPRYCPDMVFRSRDDNDCRFPERVCSNYFQRLN